MTWQAERKPASFRGLEFEAVELAHGGGNRLVVDEIPESDDHVVGELGGSPDSFRLRGFVHGDDYLDQLGNLEAAFRKRGAGELVHPWRGVLSVFIRKWDATHDTGGGVGEFEIDVVPAGLETRPTITVITETDVIDKGDVARLAAQARLDAFAADAPTWLDTAHGAIDVVNDLPSYFDAAILAAQTGELDAFERATGIEITPPAVDELTATIDDACDGVATLAGLMRYLQSPRGTDLPVGDTASAEGARASVAAYVTAMRVTSLALAAALAAAATFESADDAEDQQRALTDVVDAELELEPDDDTFTALSDLRASIVAALSETASTLPRLRTIEVNAPIPALVLAFDLYEDVEREGEILRLNRSRSLHPGFLAGPLTVLSS